MEHNDNLLIMLLRARRPERYKEVHRLEHTRIDFSGAQAELEALAKKVLDDDDEEQVLLP